MAKPRNGLTDAQKTAILLDLVSSRHTEVGVKWAVLTEVARDNGVMDGYADAIAVPLWRSLGNGLIGYELKASKADLKRELENLNKHTKIATFCDEWWLVVWDSGWLAGLEVPEYWGIATPNKDHSKLLTVRLPAHKLTRAGRYEHRPADFGLLRSLVRRAVECSPAPTLLERAYARGLGVGEDGERSRFLRGLKGPLRTKMYGTNNEALKGVLQTLQNASDTPAEFASAIVAELEKHYPPQLLPSSTP